MPGTVKKVLQLYRNEEVFTPSNEQTALDVAKEELSSLTLNDGEIIIARYQETDDDIKTLIAVSHDISDEEGITFFTDSSYTSSILEQLSLNYVRKPDVIYETNGNTGLVGVNQSALGNNWQLENYDFTPYKYLRCYIKTGDFSTTNFDLTPSMVIELPLDTASKAKYANDSTNESQQTPCDMYIAGGVAPTPNDPNAMFTVLVAVDSSKTKFQVVFENSFDTYINDVSTYNTEDDRNTDGRYLYKIEGCYDTLSSAVDTKIQNLDKVALVEVVPVSSSLTIDPYKMYNIGTVSSNLTISFNTTKEVSGYTKEYMLRFTAGNGCGITLPNGVLYAHGSAPSFVSGRTYEIDIVNNCAAIGEFY